MRVRKRPEQMKRRTKFMMMVRLKWQPNNARVGYPKMRGVSE